MDFHGMKRRDLQTLCKKHGIPANLKNIEMENRLSSLYKNETVKETTISGVSKNKECKKVTFRPDAEIFEFTRSVKKRCVTRCSQGPVRESGVEVRRSQRLVDKGKAVVDDSSGSEVDEIDDKDGLEMQKVGRRSTLLVTNVVESCVGDGTLVPAKRSKRIVEISSEEDDYRVDKVPRRCSRFLNEVDGQNKTQGRRKSVRLNGKTMEHLKDCEVQTTEKVLDFSNVEKVTRRSRRLENNVNVLVEKRPLVGENVEAGKCDDLEVRKVTKQSRQLVKSVTELLVDGQAGKCDNVKKLDVDDEMQVRLRFTRNSSRHGSYKDPTVIEETVVKKKKEEALVKSTKRVTRSMKRDRSAERGIGMETTSTQRNLTPVKLLDNFTQFEQEKAGNATEEARGSSKKSKKMNQACVKDKAQEMIENTSSSSKTKAAEYVMSTEKVLDSFVEKSADTHQRTNTQELNSELMGGTCEEKLGRDTVLMAAIEKENEEVSACSMHLTEPLSPASALLAISNSKAELAASTGHIFASTVMVEESNKTKNDSLIFSPRPEHKEHNSTAKSATAEAVLENSGECLKKIYSSNDAEKGSSEKDVQAANLHEIFSDCNTENSSAKEEMEISKVGLMSVGRSENLTPEKLSDDYAQLEPEEEGGANIEARGSSMKTKTVNQELANDNPRGMAEDSPSISGTKATESVENSDLDSTPKVSGGIFSVTDTQESNSKLMEGKREEKHEQDTVQMTETEKDKEEASSQSVFLIDRSEVKTCPDDCTVGGYLSVERTLPPASLQLSVSDPEAKLSIVTDHIFVKDIVSAVITKGDVKTKEETLVCTRRTELKEHSSDANLANDEVIMEDSAECCKEVHSSKDDQKGSLEKDLQSANSHGNFFENNNENNSAEEGMEMSEVGSMSVGRCVYLTQEKLLDAYTQLDPEEAGGFTVEDGDSSIQMKTLNQECIQDEAQGNVEDAPFTSESKATEPVMISENVVDSTPKCSGHISLVRNAQELNAELMEEELEEEQEQDTILMTVTKNDQEEASSLSVSLIERSEVSNHKAELFVETTPPPAAIQLAVISPEAGLCVATERTLLKDTASTVYPQEDISLVRNAQEFNAELMVEEREEKQEQDTVLMTATKNDKEEASSVSVSLIEPSEVSNPKAELFVETTPPPAAIQLAVSSPEAELCMATEHNFLKDIGSTVIPEEDIKTKEEIHQCELKEHNSVAKLADAEAILENSAECWNEIQSSKDDEKSSLEKEIQGNFSEYKTENSSDKEQEEMFKVGYVNLETMDEVKDDSLEKFERRISIERGCKLNVELSGWLSTDFSSVSLMEENTSKSFEEDKTKALSQPLARSEDEGTIRGSAIFTTPERSLLLMEQLSENGKTRATDSVTHQNDEALESHAVVFTTLEQVLLLEDSVLDEARQEEEHTTTDFPEESDAVNSTVRYSLLGGATHNQARNEGDTLVVELRDESNFVTRTELHRESGTCSSPDRHVLLGTSVSNETENSGGNNAMEFYEESVVYKGFEVFGSFEQDKAREREEKKAEQFSEESGFSSRVQKYQPLADSELGNAGWQEINRIDKSDLLTNLEGQLLHGDSEQRDAVETEEAAAVESHDENAVPNILERHPSPEDSELNATEKNEENKAVELQAIISREFTVDNTNEKAAESHHESVQLDEAAKGEENKSVELGVDSGICSGDMKHLQFERDEEMKSATSHGMSDVLTASESQSFMGDFESGEAVNKNVESLGESNIFTDLEKHLLSDDFGLNETGKKKDTSAATCEESFVFISPEKRLLLGNSEQQSVETQERKEVELKDGSASFSTIGGGKSDDSVVRGSRVASLDSKENTIAASGSITSKVSHSHAGQETPGAVFISKGSQVEDIVGLDATEGTLKGSRGGSPLVDSVNLFNLDIEGEETIMGAEMNTSLSSYVLALPTEGYFETFSETCSLLEVAETRSMVSEQSGSPTGIQNQISDAQVELEKTEENEADEVIEETSVTKNIQRDYKGNLMLDSSGSCSFVLAGTENEHLVSISEVVSEESGGKILEDKAIDPIATPFVSIPTEKAISPTSDEFTIQNSKNEKEGKETTPSHEETSENTKESLNIDGSGTSSEKQVRREPILIYGTQMKPKTHDMKENAPNSKMMDNLNVTALRTSKRKPLQDLSRSKT